MSEIRRKIDLMLETSRKMINTNYKQGLLILKEATALAEQDQYGQGLAWATLRKASYILREEDKPLAISYYFKALKAMEAHKDYKGVCRCHYSLATVYAMMTQYDHALTHFLQALEYAEVHDASYYPKILNNLCNAYRSLKQYDEAIMIGEQVVAYMVQNDLPRAFMPYTSLGHAYLERGAFKAALKCADKALMYLDIKDEVFYRSTANIIIAGAYKGLGHNDEALIVYNRALKILDSCMDKQNIPFINREIGDLYLIKKEYNFAFKHVQSAMTEAIKHHNSLEEAEILLVYARLYEALEDYKKAYESFKRANQIIDSSRSVQLEERYQALLIERPEMIKGHSKTLDQISADALTYTLRELKSGYSFLKKVEKGALTDAFVEAVVDTIDLRDTTTSGHSKRLANYATKMMAAINGDMIDFPEVYFTEQDIKVMYYAALLHDIGKLSVPETILLKSRRISEEGMVLLKCRIDLCGEILDHKKHTATLSLEEEGMLESLDGVYTFLHAMATAFDISDEDRLRLKEIYNFEVKDRRGDKHGILSPMHYEHLTARQGNLTDTEWRIMKNHAENTSRFLRKIPWMEGLESVPDLAGSHHEKLDGSGYPKGLKGHQLTLSVKILAIVDIFEALTAKDRPYKKTYGVSEALEILQAEAKNDKLDGKLVDFFIKEKLCYLYLKE